MVRAEGLKNRRAGGLTFKTLDTATEDSRSGVIFVNRTVRLTATFSIGSDWQSLFRSCRRAVTRQLAARVKATAGWQIAEVGHGTGDDFQPVSGAVQSRRAAE